jgi:hypothetical protein
MTIFCMRKQEGPVVAQSVQCLATDCSQYANKYSTGIWRRSDVYYHCIYQFQIKLDRPVMCHFATDLHMPPLHRVLWFRRTDRFNRRDIIAVQLPHTVTYFTYKLCYEMHNVLATFCNVPYYAFHKVVAGEPSSRSKVNQLWNVASILIDGTTVHRSQVDPYGV